jgi:serine/threonine-protein kinase
MNAADPPVQPGDVLAGKYRVERVLGAGGMGVVVAVTHLELLEPRAVKFMLPGGLADADAVERFVREARAAALLKSEHVARVYDVGRLANGAPYMVMEYLEGADLAAALKRAGALPLDEAALYVLQAAEALAEAHGRGIVHRDLKPANLFLTLRPDGAPSVKVLDFGISKFLDTPVDQDLTGTHTLLGSPNYMSPEQMHSTRDVDARSDIWSLGVILYQLLTRELPFRGRSVTEVVAAVLQGGVRPPSQLRPEIPPELDRIIFRCLERDPARRFADMGELGRALAPFSPESGPLVDSISRLVAAPARSSVGLPVAVLSESQRLALTPRSVQRVADAAPRPSWDPRADAPTLAVTPRHTPRHPGAPPLDPGAGATSAWGGTQGGRAPGRSKALLACTAAAAMAVGGLAAWFVGTGRPGSPVPAVAPASAAMPPAPVEPAKPPAVSAAATASAAPSASAAPTVLAAASASAAPRVKHAAPVADPFGMERK